MSKQKNMKAENQIEKFKSIINWEVKRYSNLVPYTTHYTKEGLEDLKRLVDQLGEIETGKRERLEGFEATGTSFSWISLQRYRAKKMVISKAYEMQPQVRPLLDAQLKSWEDFCNLFLFEDEKEI